MTMFPPDTAQPRTPCTTAVCAAALLVGCLATCPLAAQASRTAPPDSARRDSAATIRRQTLVRVVVVDTVAHGRDRYATRRSSTATRTDTPLRDVPQSATVISRALIADQAMQGMADVVRYVPGVTMAQGEGHRDQPVIRGQNTTADFFIDGIRDDAQYYRDVYNVERVEALKGPNAMTFGRGGGGGVINRVTKGAEWTPTRALAVSGGSFEQKRATLDLGQGLTPSMAMRLNALYENSATFRQQSGAERTGINPTASFMRGGTLVRLGYEFYRDRRVVDRGVPSFAGGPSPTPIRTFFGDPDASRARLDAHALSASIDKQLWTGDATISGVQLRNRTRFLAYDKFYQNVYPGAVNSAMTRVALLGYNNGTERQNLFNQTDITAVFTRGVVTQTLLVGAEIAHQRSDNIRNTAYFGASGSAATSYDAPFDAPSLATPVTFRASATDADGRTTFTTRAAYVQNQIEVGAHVQAILGLRLDRLVVDYDNRRTSQRISRTDNLASPRAGLVLKPMQPLSVYGNVGVSYLPGSGDQFGSLTATTQTLEPEQFTNREVGVKWDVRPDLALTAALYRLDRTNTTAPAPDNPALVVQTGAQRTTGWEVGASGALTARWQIAGGYASQHARIISRTSAAAAGAEVPLVPRQTLSLWNRMQLTPGLGAGIGVVYQARMFAAIDNTVTLPQFTRIDAALFAALTRTVRAQLNVENLFDRRYYATSQGNNNIMPGSPRQLRVALTVTP